MFNLLRVVSFLVLFVPCAVFAETALFIEKEVRTEFDNDLDAFCSRLAEIAAEENLKILDCEDEYSAIVLCWEQAIDRLAVISIKRNDLTRTREFSKYLNRTFTEKLYALSVTLIKINTGNKSIIFQDNEVAANSIKGLADLLVYSFLYKTKSPAAAQVVDSNDKRSDDKNFRVKKIGIGVSVVWLKPMGAYADILGNAFGGALKFSA